MVTHHPWKVTHHLKYCHPSSQRWSSSFKQMTFHHSQDGPQSSIGWSSTILIQTTVTNHPRKRTPPSPGRSLNNNRMPINHNFDGHKHSTDCQHGQPPSSGPPITISKSLSYLALADLSMARLSA